MLDVREKPIFLTKKVSSLRWRFAIQSSLIETDDARFFFFFFKHRSTNFVRRNTPNTFGSIKHRCGENIPRELNSLNIVETAKDVVPIRRRV